MNLPYQRPKGFREHSVIDKTVSNQLWNMREYDILFFKRTLKLNKHTKEKIAIKLIELLFKQSSHKIALFLGKRQINHLTWNESKREGREKVSFWLTNRFKRSFTYG